MRLLDLGFDVEKTIPFRNNRDISFREFLCNVQMNDDDEVRWDCIHGAQERARALQEKIAMRDLNKNMESYDLSNWYRHCRS